MQCGSRLELVCPSCGTVLPPGARFCSSCGHRLGDAPAPAPAQPAQADLARYIPKALLSRLTAARTAGAMQGERRVVTMLFCDVKGSTAAAEQVDPEEWADIMNGAFERLIAPVYRYEGTLARLMGDAILAFFGAPIAHEDDPERAVLAGLDIVQEIRPYIRKIRAEWGIDIDVRVGVNSGLVVVGNVGSDLRLEYTAMGDAVNLAARMEQTARPGTVQIAEETWKSVHALFELEPIGEIEVKGKSEPVRAWRVLGPKQRPASERGIAGLESPMVGRDAELARLTDAFEGLRERGGSIASVIGEAGLGKSRLVAEWRKSLAAAGRLDGVHWFEGRSLSYESGEPYAPFKAIFRGLLGLPAEDAVYEQVRDALAPLFPDDPDAVAAPIASLLGLELAGEAAHRVRYLQPAELRGRVLEAVLAIVEQHASRRPVVLVLEDLHWADSASLDLALALQGLVDGAMLLLVALLRPRPDEGSWVFHARAEEEHADRYVPIRLAPLPDDDARTLVGSLLKIDGLPVEVRDLILERAEGNPFFVEEVIRTLLDAGLVVRDGETWRATAEIRSIEVPRTLTGVLVTRLDRLEDAHRRVAQVASVIGREFDFATLAAVAPDPVVLNPALAELQRRGIVREIGRIPVRRFRFKHGLTRDAAYDTLLHKHRRPIHVAIAETWERAEVDRVPEIASHFLAGRQAERALPWAVKAGDQAAAAFAQKEAIGWYRTALEHVDTERHSGLARRAWEGLYAAAKNMFDPATAIEASEGLIALGRDQAEPCAEISGLNKKAFVLAMFRGEIAEGQSLLDIAESKARAGEDQLGLLECSMYQCYLQTGMGEFGNVERYMRDVARTGRELEIAEPQLFGMAHLATALMRTTRFDEALAQARDAIAMSERMGNRFWVAELLCWTVPMCHLRAGEVSDARRIAARGTEMALEIGASADALMGLLAQSRVALGVGDFDEALACTEALLPHAQATGFPHLIALAQCERGMAYYEIGGRELASWVSPWHMAALETMKLPLGGLYTTWVCAEIGECSLGMGRPDIARELFDAALTTPNASMYLLRPEALLGQARLHLHESEVEEAIASCREVDEYVRTRGMRHLIPEVKLLEVEIARKRGDLEAARVHAEEAEAAARDLGFLPAQYRALAHRAHIAEADGDAAAAATLAEAARAIATGLAERIGDAEIRAGFERHAGSLLPA